MKHGKMISLFDDLFSIFYRIIAFSRKENMLRGNIDGVYDEYVCGWLWNPVRPDDRVPFKLVVNGEVVGSFVASEHRADLQPAGIGDGSHAFRIGIAPFQHFAAPWTLSVMVDTYPDPEIAPWVGDPAPMRHDVTDANHENTPVDALRTIRGRLEREDSGELFGWLWDPNSAEPVRFILLIHDKPVGEFAADIRRGDLVRAGIGNGAHAFRIPLAQEWLRPGDNPVTIRILPEQRLLSDRLIVPGPTESFSAHLGNDDPDMVSAKGLIHGGANKPSLTPRDAHRLMQQWSTERLISFHQTLEKDLLLTRAKSLFRDKNWDELAQFYAVAVPNRKPRADLDALIGRALLYGGNHSKAAEILSIAATANEDNAAIKFYASVAAGRANDYESAVEWGREALKIDPHNAQYLIDHATYCRRLARNQDADQNLFRSLLCESTDCFKQAIDLTDNRREYCLYNVARNQIDLNNFVEATATIEQLLVINPDHVDGMIILGQALVALNRIREALRLAERVLELDPLRQGPRFQLRALKTLIDDEDSAPTRLGFAEWNAAEAVVTVHRFTIADDILTSEKIALIEYNADPAMALASLGVDWLLLSQDRIGHADFDLSLHRRVEAGVVARAGLIKLDRPEGSSAQFWRRELLVGLAESGIISNIGDLHNALADILPVVETVDLDAPKVKHVALEDVDMQLASGPIIAMSRHGIVKFGGGEQFLDSMAEHYEQMGFDPIIVGTRTERVGEEGIENGRRYAFVDMKPAALRAYFLRVRPRLVHVLSGLGFQVAEALDYLTIPFIYGVHFWRDCLGAAVDDGRFFEAHDRQPIPKPAFRYVLEKASTVYANSEYTRTILEEAFAVRTPVVYSLPREIDRDRQPLAQDVQSLLGDWRDYILLVNAKSDKGFNLLVDAAKLVPHARFLVIASQSDQHEAIATIKAAGIGNIRVIGHTNRMDILYMHARAVAVASYRFVETFSRVCIEAQRYGKPVLGSTVGNVPYLLKTSGVVLPENVDSWSSEISKIYLDEDYYHSLVAAAYENSEKYGYDTQVKAIHGILATISSSILIGVGSGIGNMLHVAPMIRNIARRLGRKVDLVVTEDHQNSLFLLQNDEYVNAVYSVRQAVLRKKYDTVFITHSFGNARLPFQANTILYARDWQNFEPGGEYHETIYNLESAKAVLGIDYDEADVGGYYLGNYKYTPPVGGTVRIGVHGGSKDGFWRSKRWPYHAELAQRLQARGFEVASFGIAEEYVPGTKDMTGGTIGEMVEHMLGLDYFISNDSGLMNIANALGIPVIGLFAPTNPLTRGPIGPDSRWLAIEKDCAPCEVSKIGRQTFHAGSCKCIAEMSLERVENAVMEHIGQRLAHRT